MAEETRPRPLASFGLEGDDWGGVVRYGPLVPDERDVRLLGTVAAKRVLLLGTGGGQAAAALAGAGAKVIAVEPSDAGVAHVRQYCAARGVSVEVHHRDLAELAFVRADTVDVALSVLSLAAVADLGRVFRQVHRVLRSEAPLVLSLPHPTTSLLQVVPPGGDTGDAGAPGGGASATVTMRRGYTESQPLRWSLDAGPSEGEDHTHTIEGTFTALTRANFRVDTLLEPLARPGGRQSPYWVPAMDHLPAVLLVRARKLGA
ncbi:MAG: methyltransferase domain-containing protein [Acidimicrobiia bacterium]|nr:methyltransferase domain-containing protein [Acidimicrobiia bacterium]